MNEEYVLLSMRAGGWFTRQATYSSELADAHVLNEKDAFDYCRLHISQGKLGMVPVRLSDLRRVLE